MATIYGSMTDFNCLDLMLLHLQVTRLDDNIFVLLVSKQMKSNDIQVLNMLGDQEPHSQDTHPLGGKQRCTMILEAMI
jgi:hypothetical protein